MGTQKTCQICWKYSLVFKFKKKKKKKLNKFVAASLSGNKHSDDSSSSIYDSRMTTNKTLASKYQSDSDETNKTKRFARFSNLNNGSNIESDSVNENFVPRTNIKRKRKFKRMAIDSDSNPSTSQGVALMTNSTVGKKKRIFRNDCDNRYGNIWYQLISCFLFISPYFLNHKF